MAGISFIVPHGYAHARAYIGIPVEEALAQRSSVMATLMECEGVVELPDGVAVADFMTWSDFQPEEAATLSAEELTQALKVRSRLIPGNQSLPST